MIAVLSPAKSLDFEYEPSFKPTLPDFLELSNELASILSKKPADELKELMNLSDSLAELNADRYANWQNKPGKKQTCPAGFAFTGDVYRGMDLRSKNKSEIDYAAKHVRILSGIYGVLRVTDAIQPYRLEMGTKLQTPSGKNLYEFWGDLPTEKLNAELKKQKSDTLVNLASNEYFKVINKKKLEANIITPEFKDYKGDKFKVISFYAKKARGAMAAFMMQNNIKNAEELNAFTWDGYALNNKLSKNNKPVFTRGEQ